MDILNSMLSHLSNVLRQQSQLKHLLVGGSLIGLILTYKYRRQYRRYLKVARRGAKKRIQKPKNKKLATGCLIAAIFVLVVTIVMTGLCLSLYE